MYWRLYRVATLEAEVVSLDFAWIEFQSLYFSFESMFSTLEFIGHPFWDRVETLKGTAIQHNLHIALKLSLIPSSL